jgi:hypothetical protein
MRSQPVAATLARGAVRETREMKEQRLKVGDDLGTLAPHIKDQLGLAYCAAMKECYFVASIRQGHP